MSIIVKTTMCNCDLILEQEYPNEDAAQNDQGKKITNAKILNLKIINVKYKTKQEADAGINTRINVA
jgi:hypothetical protein